MFVCMCACMSVCIHVYMCMLCMYFYIFWGGLLLQRKFPKIFQSFVTSATMFDDVKKLKSLILHNPVILRLEEPPLPTAEQLTQYVIKVGKVVGGGGVP